jgi:hypothetical protein
MQGCFAGGITSINLGMKTHQQLHQVLAPLLGRDEQRPLPACSAQRPIAITMVIMSARTAACTRTAKLEAERRRRASGSGVGVGAGLEEALGILELAELHLRDERCLARERVLAL